jgi:hypothetical protein
MAIGEHLLKRPHPRPQHDGHPGPADVLSFALANGSTRRKCTDYEEHLRSILSKYARYYNEVRTHLGRAVPARSSGSETLSRNRSLAGYTIDMSESEFSEGTGAHGSHVTLLSHVPRLMEQAGQPKGYFAHEASTWPSPPKGTILLLVSCPMSACPNHGIPDLRHQ